MPAVAMSAAAKPLTTQFNVRMDAVLKKAGDEALRRAGLTPTEAVRALWEYVSQPSLNPAEIRTFLESGKSKGALEEGETERERRMEWVRRGPQILEAYFKEQGLSESPYSSELSVETRRELDDELKLQYFEEKYGPICL